MENAKKRGHTFKSKHVKEVLSIVKFSRSFIATVGNQSRTLKCDSWALKFIDGNNKGKVCK